MKEMLHADEPGIHSLPYFEVYFEFASLQPAAPIYKQQSSYK